MSKYYDELQADEAFAIAPLTEPRHVLHEPGLPGKCDFCKREVWLSPKTLEFMQKHEVPAICTECAKGLVMEAKK